MGLQIGPIVPLWLGKVPSEGIDENLVLVELEYDVW